MPKIVVLDGHTLNPGDISWEPVSRLAGNFTVYPRTSEAEALGRAIGAKIVLTNKTPLRKGTLDRLPGLEYLGVLATGYNVVDVKYARELGIPVTNVPAYGTQAVAQYAIGLLLELTGHVGHHARAIQDGRWRGSPDWCFWDFPLVELAGKTMGIIGYGAIGSKVAGVALALGMRVLAYNGKRPPKDTPPGVTATSLEGLLRASDVISLHAPLNGDTEGIIDGAAISMMKDGVLIVNTARGGLIVDSDLAAALERGKVRAAALDVMSSEPAKEDNPLLSARNCLITPHLAWSPVETRERLMEAAAMNIAKFLEGAPVNVVNP
jgi:glycerate dehydrogenase